MFDEIHSDVNRTEDHTKDSCSFSIDFYWTQDELIRSELASLECLFLFKDGASPACTTGTISITFAGMNRIIIDIHIINWVAIYILVPTKVTFSGTGIIKSKMMYVCMHACTLYHDIH